MAAVALLAWTGAACAGERIAPATIETDSADVRIVTSDRPLEEWALHGDAELDLGTVDSVGPTQFFRVEAVEFVPEGRFVVANRGTEELRFFTTDGVFLGAVGREGHGPEEFRGLSWLAKLGDSLLTYDWGNDRISVRDLSGTYGRSFRLEWISGLLTPLAVLSNATILSVSVRHMTELEGTGTLLEVGLVHRHDLTGEIIDTVGRFPVGERVVHREGDLQTTIGLPISHQASFAARGTGFCSTFGPAFQVTCFDEQGTPRTMARVDSLPSPVTPEHVAQAFEHELETARAAGNIPRERALLRARPSMEFPEAFPAFTELLIDDEDRIWVERYARPGDDRVEWWVFEAERWIARITVDPAYQPMDVRDDLVIGVWRDDLGIERIRIYRFAPL